MVCDATHAFVFDTEMLPLSRSVRGKVSVVEKVCKSPSPPVFPHFSCRGCKAKNSIFLVPEAQYNKGFYNSFSSVKEKSISMVCCVFYSICLIIKRILSVRESFFEQGKMYYFSRGITADFDAINTADESHRRCYCCCGDVKRKDMFSDLSSTATLITLNLS